MMLKTSIFTLVTAVAAFGCEGDAGPVGPAGPPGGLDPNAPAVDKAFYGLGGRDAIADLAGFRITASGERLLSLEGFAPEDDSGTVSTFDAETASDLTNDRLRAAYKRKHFVFGTMADYRVLINKNVGVVDGTESAFGIPGGALTSDRWASTMRQHRLLNPHILLREVAQGSRTATDKGVAFIDGELRHKIELTDEVRPISLFVDRFSGELTSLSTFENDLVTGDVKLEVHYSGWKTWDDSGIAFPADVVLAVNDQALHAERRSAVTVNPSLEASLFAFPSGSSPQHVAADATRGARNGQFHEGFAGLGVPLDGLQTTVEAELLATGIYHLRGGTHNSLVIEQETGVVVVEAPLYEARAKAIYAWIAMTFPTKQVTHVVSSHHHRDHAGALRTFVARNAKVVLGALAKPFFANAFRATRTIDPDELAATPRPAVIETVPVGGEFLIQDNTRPVRVIHVPSTHSNDMVIAYVANGTVPNGSVMFVSDIYSPGFPGSPIGPREVLQVVVDKTLTIDKIAGGHGTTGTRQQLEMAAM